MKQLYNTHKSIPLLIDGELEAVWIGSWQRIDVYDKTDSWGGIIGGWNAQQDIITLNVRGTTKANRVFRILLNAIRKVK